MNHLEKAVGLAKAYSPYLTESLDAFPDIVLQLSDRSPEDVFEDIISNLSQPIGTLDVEMEVLREFKRKAHLCIALADIASVWDWVPVTERLTQIADLSMKRLLRSIALEKGIEGTKDNPVPGLFTLAVGKYGTRELNYSSDIDFSVFYDPDVITVPRKRRAERDLIKIVQNLIRGFEHITGSGYIFRTDLRLRPDPRSNAVAVSIHTAERYYQSLGQNWERAAMIKARVCGGDQAVGEAFISDVLGPFIWRKNLDYAAIEDILAMKRQIHIRHDHSVSNLYGHNLKLGHGGIREIEFFAQTQQLILGARDTEIRTPRTLDAIQALTEHGFCEPEVAAALSDHYGELRRLEHRLQMIKDEQTHSLPEDVKGMEDFAVFAGFKNVQNFETDLVRRLTDVRAKFAALFPDIAPLSSSFGSLSFTGVEADPHTLETMRKHGFLDPETVWQAMSQWLGGRIPAMRTRRSRELLTKLAPILIEICAQQQNPDKAFLSLGQFFSELNSADSLLALFTRQPDRLEFLVNIISQSPHLISQLSQRPETLDALADLKFFEVGRHNLAVDYHERFASMDDFERAINLARKWVKEDLFRLDASIISGLTSIRHAGPLYSHIANETLIGLLPVAIAEIERVFQALPGQVGIIALGKLGSYEMSPTSDLDIMLVYEADDDQTEDYRVFTRLTQRLVTAVSAYTEEGRIYEVDMALRPSGRSGPVAVSLNMFSSYYEAKAWSWEFMALSRARIVSASSPSFEAKLTDALEKAKTAPRPDLNFKSDIAEMLERLRREKPARSIWDVKRIEGGLRGVEFLAQSLYLQNRDLFKNRGITSTSEVVRFVHKANLITDALSHRLLAATEFMQDLTQSIGLIVGSNLDQIKEDEEISIAALCGYEAVSDFKTDYDDHRSQVQTLVKALIYAA